MSEIRNWKNQEGLITESAWLSEGIRIFRKLVNENPENIEYKTDLARLLIRSGSDEKLRYVHLTNAQRLFEEVLELFPHDAEALYRLGHICYEKEKFDKCIAYFLEALEQPLSETRRFRVYSTVSKAYYHICKYDMSHSFLQKSIEADKERNFTNEIEEIKRFITEDGRSRKLVQFADGATLLITTGEVESFKVDAESDHEAVLDLSHFYPTFYGPSDCKRLEPKEAEILRCLIERKNRFVRKEELVNLWEEGEQPQMATIKSYISKIRTKVKACLLEENSEIILGKRGGGYQWTCSVPTNLIKQL
ncbi:winged helix-turn-helix domain-containing protein [Neobacillus sp. SM06]|uniref:winged helix-turn-helix domain-containing protein n=1 Tax=Neobacillus sp. SM06 TaxID=3422492 RepID=UPI003D2E4C09